MVGRELGSSCLSCGAERECHYIVLFGEVVY